MNVTSVINDLNIFDLGVVVLVGALGIGAHKVYTIPSAELRVVGPKSFEKSLTTGGKVTQIILPNATCAFDSDRRYSITLGEKPVIVQDGERKDINNIHRNNPGSMPNFVASKMIGAGVIPDIEALCGRYAMGVIANITKGIENRK